MNKKLIIVLLLFFTSCIWETHEWNIRYEITGNAGKVYVTGTDIENKDFNLSIDTLPWVYAYDVKLNDSDDRHFLAALSVVKADGSGSTTATVRLFVRDALVDQKVITLDNQLAVVQFECDSYE